MPDAIKVELFYSGTEVEDGTVPVEDMVDALVGFSNAYDKIAKAEEPPDTGHRIRVVGVERGSARILVDVVEWITRNPAAAGVLATVGLSVTGGAYKILKDLAGVIMGKKALHGQPITNNGFIFNNSHITLNGVNLTPRQLGYLQSGILDPDLDRMTRLLEQGRGVNEFKLKARNEELVRVSANERLYFTHSDASVTTTQDGVWLEGTLNSHSKRNNRGMFHMINGKRIPYRYVGDDIQPLLRAYAYNGVVKVFGKVKLDAEHAPVSIEIRDIQITQPVLF